MRKWRSKKLNKLLNKKLFKFVEIFLIFFFFITFLYVLLLAISLCIQKKLTSKHFFSLQTTFVVSIYVSRFLWSMKSFLVFATPWWPNYPDLYRTYKRNDQICFHIYQKTIMMSLLWHNWKKMISFVFSCLKHTAFVRTWQTNNIWRKQCHNFVLRYWNRDKWSNMFWQYPNVLPDMFYRSGK